MNPKNLKSLPTEDLLAKLTRAVEKEIDGWDQARYGRGGLGQKRSEELLNQPYQELLSRGADGGESLRTLLLHPRPGVRMWAAMQAVYSGLDPTEPEKVIFDLASEKGRIGNMARRWLADATLPDWEDGDD